MTRPTLDDLKATATTWSRTKKREKSRSRIHDGRHHHLAMLGKFGYTDGKTCGECVHLKRKGGNARNYYGCELSPIGLTSSECSDWRLKWAACGKFEEKR